MGSERPVDLTPKERELVLTLLANYLPDTEVWAYGSRVKWTSTPKSDLDLVAFATPDQAAAVEDLREAFEESNLPFRVDLVVWDEVPESFRPRIGENYAAIATPDRRAVGWRIVELGDCVVMNDRVYNARKPWPFIKYLDTGSITENRITRIQTLDPATDKIPTRARRLVRPGDLVYSTVRPNQRHFGLLKAVPENFLVSTGFAVMRGIDGMADTGFVYHVLTHDRNVERLQAIAEHSTSAYPSVRPADLARLTLRLPTLAEQRAIGRMLGALDDRIGLNRRMNETLEAMARALFRSWFVDFDPVRARMEGRATGLPPGIADLFPNRIADSEMGEIPEGWEVTSLGEVAFVSRDGTDPASEASDTPYIGLGDMPRGSIALTDWSKIGSVSSRKSTFLAGDILFGKLRPYFHKVGIAPVDGFCSTDILVLRSRRPDWFSLVLACVSSSEFVAHTSQSATGTKMPRTSWQAMSGYELCRPTDAIASGFERIVSPMLGRIVRNIHESRTLAALRDALLPKLVSGEIRVPTANREAAR